MIKIDIFTLIILIILMFLLAIVYTFIYWITPSYNITCRERAAANYCNSIGMNFSEGSLLGDNFDCYNKTERELTGKSVYLTKSENLHCLEKDPYTFKWKGYNNG